MPGRGEERGGASGQGGHEARDTRLVSSVESDSNSGVYVQKQFRSVVLQKLSTLTHSILMKFYEVTQKQNLNTMNVKNMLQSLFS